MEKNTVNDDCGQESEISAHFGISVKNVDHKRVYDKRHACYFCNKHFLKIARHLELKHKQELQVAKILAKPKNSKQRRDEFMLLAKVGDYYHNMEVLATGVGELLLARRPNESMETKYEISSFGPCPYCLGFMLKKHLWLHAKKCSAIQQKNDENLRRTNIKMLSDALVNSVTCNGIDSVYRENIVDTMKNDVISTNCKNDILILQFGKMAYEKHGNSQRDLIRQGMRQLGRLRMELLCKQKEFTCLKDFIVPQQFDNIVEAVRTLCKATFERERQKLEYGVPSLALKLGYSLKKCVGILRGLALRKGDISYETKLKSFLDIMDLEWSVRISSNAIATMHRKKMNTAKLVPLTTDLIKLNDFIYKEIDANMVLLTKNRNDKDAWYKLAQLTLARIILFNKRRSGEASRMLVSQYKSKPNWDKESSLELQNSLTQFEKKLANDLKLVQIEGKRSRTVPVLLTKNMCTAIDLLLETRADVGITKSNPYVFSRLYKGSSGHLRGPDSLRTIVNKTGIELPETITGTKLRKYVATVCQVFDLKEYEIEWLSRHLGHDIKIHRDFYRLQESAIELTKISRLLMTIDEGKASNFYGKSLENINLNDLPEVVAEASDDEEQDVVFKNVQNLNEEKKKKISTTVAPSSKNDKTVKAPVSSGDRINSSIDSEEEYTEPKPKRRKFIRKPWNSDEAAAVIRFFRMEIKRQIVPGKFRCVQLLEKCSETLRTRNWRDIKYYVKNHITKCKRRP